jgi:hypothetical protein
MTEILAGTWATVDGWATAHKVEIPQVFGVRYGWLICGRMVDRELIPAPVGMRHCGQCERRRS